MKVNPAKTTETRRPGAREILGTVNFGWEESLSQTARGTKLSLKMVLDPKNGFRETWFSQGQVSEGSRGNLRWAHDGEWLFGACELPKADALGALVRGHYLEVFELMESLGYPDMFRVWNFIPKINDENPDHLETYRDFCAGRSEAFEIGNWHRRIAMPAATGIGTLGTQVGFFFLATRGGRVTHLENPRQMPAYTYPPEYGPRSPSFARATAVQDPVLGGGRLYISGTASIIGHGTVHPGDAGAQCDVTLDNIRLLIEEPNLRRHGLALDRSFTLGDLDFIKVYYRNENDLPVVRQKCREAFSPGAQVRFLQVDICRASLLVEIEGIVSWGNPGVLEAWIPTLGVRWDPLDEVGTVTCKDHNQGEYYVS